jgi:hypothetical protein
MSESKDPGSPQEHGGGQSTEPEGQAPAEEVYATEDDDRERPGEGPRAADEFRHARGVLEAIAAASAAAEREREAKERWLAEKQESAQKDAIAAKKTLLKAREEQRQARVEELVEEYRKETAEAHAKREEEEPSEEAQDLVPGGVIASEGFIAYSHPEDGTLDPKDIHSGNFVVEIDGHEVDLSTWSITHFPDRRLTVFLPPQGVSIPTQPAGGAEEQPTDSDAAYEIDDIEVADTVLTAQDVMTAGGVHYSKWVGQADKVDRVSGAGPQPTGDAEGERPDVDEEKDDDESDEKKDDESGRDDSA